MKQKENKPCTTARREAANRFIKRRAIGVKNWTSIMIYYKDHRNRSHFFHYGQN